MHEVQVINRQVVDMKLFIVQLCEIVVVSFHKFDFLKTES